MTKDLGCFPYKKIKQPKLTDLPKKDRAKFAHWVLNNYTKEDTKKWLFTEEHYFDLDGVHNVQNDRVWVVGREEADKQGGICNDNSGMIGIPFILITSVSKVVDPMTDFTIISISSSSTLLLAYILLSLSLSLLFLFLFKDVVYVK